MMKNKPKKEYVIALICIICICSSIIKFINAIVIGEAYNYALAEGLGVYALYTRYYLLVKKGVFVPLIDLFTNSLHEKALEQKYLNDLRLVPAFGSELTNLIIIKSVIITLLSIILLVNIIRKKETLNLYKYFIAMLIFRLIYIISPIWKLVLCVLLVIFVFCYFASKGEGNSQTNNNYTPRYIERGPAEKFKYWSYDLQNLKSMKSSNPNMPRIDADIAQAEAARDRALIDVINSLRK